MEGVRIIIEPYLESQAKSKGVNLMALAAAAAKDTAGIVPSMPDEIWIVTGFIMPFSRFYPESNKIVTFLPPLFRPYYGIEERDQSIKYSLMHEFSEPMVFKPGSWEIMKNTISEVMLPFFENGNLLGENNDGPSMDDVRLQARAVARDVVTDRLIVRNVAAGAEGFVIFQNQQYGKTRHFLNSVSSRDWHDFDTCYDVVSNFLSCARRSVIASEIRGSCSVKPQHMMYLSRYRVQLFTCFMDKILQPAGCKEAGMSILGELSSDSPNHAKIFTDSASIIRALKKD